MREAEKQLILAIRSALNTITDLAEDGKITQIVFIPIPKVELVPVETFEEETQRGEDGFGSTGR